MHTVGLVLAWLVAVMIIWVGVMYLLKNEANAAGFGLPNLPDRPARAWWQLKGVRDVTSGIVVILLSLVQPTALPWLIIAETLIPFGDMLVVLGNRGSRARAFGIHGLTAAVMIIAAVLLWLG
ncbi:DUF4267 domain-containing protein [Microlunatus sp. Gsoil 973]|jgi:hypothetical protein|uniref:DUF4267 domain-containing protein n=1 Tax=Microlunatus sp. Gsoil 973 TaxID=2672569 RepID=UPI0012B4E2D1|nr:DUF4267 domain-containing protein [Microlunatus sp. Gsoil 973]QGN35017.1 DUF4267 domain-containing protein [Microlunatus sp. Gsoil 973]